MLTLLTQKSAASITDERQILSGTSAEHAQTLADKCAPNKSDAVDRVNEILASISRDTGIIDHILVRAQALRT